LPENREPAADVLDDVVCERDITVETLRASDTIVLVA
jgi:hypothetical protein